MNTLKNMLAIVAFLFANTAAVACDVCKKQQPEILQGIAHGAGPQSDWDYVVVWCTVIIVIISFFYTVKWILHPCEKGSEHIKRSIFNFE